MLHLRMFYFVQVPAKKRIRLFLLFVIVCFLNNGRSQNIGQNFDTIEIERDSSYKITGVRHPRMATLADSLIDYAYTFIGDRYRRGGTGAKGFDCSGYTMTVFKRFGIKLPHTSAGQGLIGIDISRNNIKKGDLILFKGHNRRSRRIGHVGIVITEKGDPVKFIHSSVSDGVRIDRLEFDYYRNRFVKVIRLPQLYR